MICSNCGAPNDGQSAFCESCGNKLTETKIEPPKSVQSDYNIVQESQNTYSLFSDYPAQKTGQKQNNSQNTIDFSTNKGELKGANATGAIVLGILGIICVIINFFGVPFIHIVGIILGAVGLASAKRAKSAGFKNTAVAIVFCVIAITGGIIAMIIGFITVMMMSV